jgi:Transposase DDE domain
MTWILTPGQRHEATQAPALLEQGAVRRGNGHLRMRPERVAGDKGYTGRPIRGYLRRRGDRGGDSAAFDRTAPRHDLRHIRLSGTQCH